MSGKPFFDTNIVLYAFNDDDPRGEVARSLLATGGVISVQTLNEFVSVARRKIGLSWEQIAEALNAIRTLCPRQVPITVQTHEAAVDIAERFGYQIYDSLIIAAASEAKCKTLYSEDMQDGQKIGGVVIRNPFGRR